MVAILNYIYQDFATSFDPVPSLPGTPYYVPDPPRPKYNKFPDLQLPRLTPHSAQIQLPISHLGRFQHKWEIERDENTCIYHPELKDLMIILPNLSLKKICLLW